ncbi:MAG: ABC transporter permease [Defluviitaleaceae bacterium]|nr:ABC transporter permease [Defluviitaleaceae bacterium]
MKNKLAVGAFCVLGFIILLCIFVPIFSPYSMQIYFAENRLIPPSPQHWLGTDVIGRDLFTRLFVGGRISLGIGLLVTFINTLVGFTLGSLSGFYGKWVDAIIMRLSEMISSLPFMFTAIVIVALFGNSIPTLIATFAALTWPGITRIIRGQILMLREAEYMKACEALGINHFKRITRHLLPNLLPFIIVYATLNIASVILMEAALSFLGMGVSPPTPTWGNLIEPARQMVNLMNRAWLFIPPGIMIFLTVMCFNIVGDGLRDAVDPKSRGR